MTPRERADRARQILNDPVFVEALRDIRDNIVRLIEQTGMGDIDEQHQLAMKLSLLKSIPQQFKAYADSLVVEQHKERQQGFIEKVKQRYRA